MKKYIVPFAQLALFFVILTPGVVIGMETDIPKLPSEVNKLILTKVLRLVLDEVEDDPHQLTNRKRSFFFSSPLIKHMIGTVECYESVNNIDYIIKLIKAKDIGVDPNTKSYKGNNALHLLVSEVLLQTKYLGETEFEYQWLHNKIALLSKYKIDFNAKNAKGDTIGHELIEQVLKAGCRYIKEEPENLNLMFFLADLGLDLTKINNNIGQTPIELGKALIESRINELDYSLHIIPLMRNWMYLLTKMDKRNKNYYGKLLWELVQRKISELGGISQTEKELLWMLYNVFMTAE